MIRVDERKWSAFKGEGRDVIAAPGNVGDTDDGPRMVAQAITDLGGLDYLVNNAGTPGTRSQIPPAQLDKLTEELWDVVVAVNLRGAVSLFARCRAGDPGAWRGQS